MMEKGWRNKPIKAIAQVQKLKPTIDEIVNERTSKIGQKIVRVLTDIFGGTQSSGLLNDFMKTFEKYQPLQWIHEIEAILSIIEPGSPFVDRLVINTDIRIVIGEKFMPNNFNITRYNKEKKNIDIREGYKGYSVAALDAYFLFLVNAIYHQDSYEGKTMQHQQLRQDDFFSQIWRNPLLILLRKCLQFFQNSKICLQKLIGAIKIFIMDDIIDKHERQSRLKYNMKNDTHDSLTFSMRESFHDKMTSFIRPQRLKYKLKQSFIHCLYLSLKYASEYFSDLKKYILGICQNYSSISKNDRCLYGLIRLWVFSLAIKDSHNMELKVIEAMRKSNSKDGWFELERYSLNRLAGSNHLSHSAAIVVQSLIQLFEKDMNWAPNCTYIYIIALFFKFLDEGVFYANEIETNRKPLISDISIQTKEQIIMKKLLDRINHALVEIVNEFQKYGKKEQFGELKGQLYSNLQIIAGYYSRYVESKKSQSRDPYLSMSKLHNNIFNFKNVTEEDLTNHEKSAQIVSGSIQSDQKLNLVSFYRRQPKQIWQVPIQYHESTILFYAAYFLAKLIDLLTPGRRQYPWLNIRFLATPLYFVVLMIGVLIVLKFML